MRFDGRQEQLSVPDKKFIGCSPLINVLIPPALECPFIFVSRCVENSSMFSFCISICAQIVPKRRLLFAFGPGLKPTSYDVVVVIIPERSRKPADPLQTMLFTLLVLYQLL